MPDDSDTPEKPKLRPANENPWYVLATLHGEQPEGAHGGGYDARVHAKNRRDWNKLASRHLSEVQKDFLLKLCDDSGSKIFELDDLTTHSEDEFAELSKLLAGNNLFNKFNTNELMILLNSGGANFYSVQFCMDVIFNGFIFLKMTSFGSCLFDKNSSFKNCV
ncbi:MAG: hypothetical protein ACRCWO_08455, partial [Bosea sp. (in: a-proteobacteria)]